MTYPPGGTLGPRTQSDLQLVLVHAGSARVWVGDVLHTIAAGEVGLLLPGHRERFAFDTRVATRHSWVQAGVPEVPGRFAALPAVLPLSPALDTLVREAVATVALPGVVAHLAAAAFLRYAGEAERRRPERARPADDAQRFIHAHLHEPQLTLGDVARPRTSRPRTSSAASAPPTASPRWRTSGSGASRSRSTCSWARACRSRPSPSVAASRPSTTSRAASPARPDCHRQRSGESAGDRVRT